ncbi:MAG: hypothetical protein ACREDR_23830 [Blastocatellia bacterium]
MRKRKISVWFPLMVFFACCPMALPTRARTQTKKAGPRTTTPPITDAQKNIEEYIDLIRNDVKQQKAEIMGSVIQLGADDAAKFWPIYSEYDAELTKLNDLRTENTIEYARTYTEMTDAKADELIKKAIDYQRQRSDLLAKYYVRVKDAIGAINAARFVQIEHQLLLIIDLQIASQLPVIGKQ